MYSVLIRVFATPSFCFEKVFYFYESIYYFPKSNVSSE